MGLKFRKVKKNAEGESTLFTSKNLMWVGGGIAAIFVIRYLMKKAKPAEAGTLPDGTPLTQKQINAAKVQQDIASGKLVFVPASGTTPGHWARTKAAQGPAPVNGTPEDNALLEGVGGIFSSGRGLGIL